jgi:hypothetical protein
MMLRACTSKKVMPRNPGVSNDLVTALRSNSAGAVAPACDLLPAGAVGAASPVWIRMASHRMG